MVRGGAASIWSKLNGCLTTGSQTNVELTVLLQAEQFLVYPVAQASVSCDGSMAVGLRLRLSIRSKQLQQGLLTAGSCGLYRDAGSCA